LFRLAVETVLTLYHSEKLLQQRIPSILQEAPSNNSNNKTIYESTFLLLDVNNVKIYCTDGDIKESQVIRGVVLEAEVDF
jgi:hypothetical protein